MRDKILNVCKWILKHAGIFIVLSIIYIITFHISFLNVTGVYFYDSIFKLVIVAIIGLIGLVLSRKKLKFDYKDVLLSLCVFGLVNMLFLSLCIVSLDRSLSVFLLCYMDECEEGLTSEEIDETFKDVFIEKYDMLGRRFEEQLVSGNLSVEGDKYKLTDRGKWFVSVFKAVGNMYNVDRRFINPKIE